MRSFLTLSLPLLFSLNLFAQLPGSFWTEKQRQEVLSTYQDARVLPHIGRFYHLDFEGIKQKLRQGRTVDILLPDPEGTLQPFQATWSPSAEPAYFLAHPESGTYTVRHSREPEIHGRIDHTIAGFHAMIHYGESTLLIDPVFSGRTDLHTVYFKNDFWADPSEAVEFSCAQHEELVQDPEALLEETADLREFAPVDQVRYRLVIATTGEYSQYHGGTKALVSAELLTAVNRINTIMERDMGIHLDLVADNDKVIFMDPATDGFTNGQTDLMINENPTRIGLFFSLDKYDIGHVFGVATNGQVGLAQLGCVCTSSKARGVSGLFTPKFDPFYINVISHEMGHQFAATHSFNKCLNENPGTGWEPGGGSTIMSYSGSCGANSVKSNADDYYHGGSLAQMKSFIRVGSGAQCGTKIPTNNEAPVADFTYKNGFHIPISTPFKLTAQASDANGDVLSYCWEGMDTGPITDAGSPVQTSPLFRSFPASLSPERVFPRMVSIAQKTYSKFEHLPDYTREMTFRISVRDNYPETGGLAQKDLLFYTSELAGPFQVISFPTVDTVRQGDYLPIEWKVAGTDLSPVNCKKVNIRMSLDAGLTWPLLLASDVPNTGSFHVSIPKVTTGAARFMVEAADNIFFNISGGNVRVLPPTEPGFSVDLAPFFQQACIPGAATVTVRTESLLNFNEPVSLSIVDGLPSGATATFDQAIIVPPATANLTIDLSNAQQGGSYTLILQAMTASGKESLRPMQLNVVRSDFSSLNAVSPASGTSGVGSSPELRWVAQEDASHYQVELSTAPSFPAAGTILSGPLTDTTFQVLATLKTNTLYFWRVLPSNSCGAPQDVPVYAFHTASLDCSDYTNTTEVVIPNQGKQTIQSKISIPKDGTVSEIRVPKITGNHQNIGQLRGSLKSPAGKTVRLFAGQCFVIAGNINMGFTDESLVPFSCPPDKGQIHQSEESLASLAGDNIKGDWTLVLEDVATGAGGKLSSWTLSLCASITPQDPFLVLKDTLFLSPGQTRTLGSDLLLAQDNDNTASELSFHLVKLPLRGTLYRNGLPLVIGESFTQEDLNNGLVSFEDTGGVEGDDRFLFTVRDGSGGWLGIESFPIRTDGTVSIADQDKGVPFAMYPNPADGTLWIRFGEMAVSTPTLTITSAAGQSPFCPTLAVGHGQIHLDVSHLPVGVYFATLHMGERRSVQRFIISR